jgi:ribonucleotide reductase beta subunit family protein with ferritin-like domain
MTITCTQEVLLKNQHLEHMFEDNNKYVLTVPDQYRDVWDLYKKQEGTMWKREEVDVAGDLEAWGQLDDSKRHFIKMILAFFAASDGIVNENLAINFANEIQVSCIRAYYSAQQMVETVHCVTGNTRILTDKGYFPIETLENTKVNVWNGEEFSNVEILYTGNSEIYKVTLDNGMDLECTPGHKWLIRTDNSEHPECCKIKKIETKDVKIGDIIGKYDLPIIDCGNDEFKNPYIHGFFCGDGTYSNNYPLIHLYGEKKKLLKYFEIEKFNESDFRIRFYITNKINKPKYEVPINENMNNRLRWLEGICDSDGCISYNKNKTATSIQIASIHEPFLKNIQLMLTTMGVNARISVMKDEGKTGDYGYFETKKCFVMYITCKSVSSLMKIGFKPKRLQIILNEDVLESTNSSKLLRILKIEKIHENERTFCFNEPKKHTGIFNGILTGQSETYAALIETYISNDEERDKYFHALENFACIRKKAEWTQKWMNKDIPFAIRLIAFCVVEGIFFSGSFCAIFWLKDQHINMKGLFSANEFISRDENLHCVAGVTIFKKLKYIPDEQIVSDLFKDAIEHEIQFINEAIPCKMIGMNSDLMSQYIKYVGDMLLSQLGYTKLYNVENPFSFMGRSGMDNISNFHTRRVTEYARSSKIEKIKTVESFDTSEDF